MSLYEKELQGKLGYLDLHFITRQFHIPFYGLPDILHRQYRPRATETEMLKGYKVLLHILIY